MDQIVIGIAGLPHVARAFSGILGVRVLTGESFALAAKSINSELRQNPTLFRAIITADTGADTHHSAASWFTGLNHYGQINNIELLCIRLADHTEISAPGITFLDAPVSVEHVLGAAGIENYPEELRTLKITPNGELAQQVYEQAPIDEDDDLFLPPPITGDSAQEASYADPWAEPAKQEAPSVHPQVEQPSLQEHYGEEFEPTNHTSHGADTGEEEPQEESDWIFESDLEEFNFDEDPEPDYAYAQPHIPLVEPPVTKPEPEPEPIVHFEAPVPMVVEPPWPIPDVVDEDHSPHVRSNHEIHSAVTEPLPAFVPSPDRRLGHPSPVVPPEHNDRNFEVPSARQRGQVIISFAAKGGVGKSTTAIALAQGAAEYGRLRAVVIDANSGQGDQRKYLGFSENAPDVHYAALTGNPRDAILTPNMMPQFQTRGDIGIKFSIALAPNYDASNPELVTEQVYASVIEYARTIADLVIIDTQIMESTDKSGLFDHVILPLLLDGAWAVGIAEPGFVPVKNLNERMHLLASYGIPRDRILLYISKADPDKVAGLNEGWHALESHGGTFVGVVTFDPEIHSASEEGRLPLVGSITPMVKKILHMVTADPSFEPDPQKAPARKWFSFFSKGDARA